MIGTVKDGNGVRLIPRREVLQKYALWGKAMCRGDEFDFVPVHTQRTEDFKCLQSAAGPGKQIETASARLITTRDY
jgi:hypothetical protein